jgi:hypothetical protein
LKLERALFYGKLKEKRERFFKNIVTIVREFALLKETLKQKGLKTQRIKIYEERKPQRIQNKILKEGTKIFKKLRHDEYKDQRPPLYGRGTALLEVTVGITSTAK